jgi:pseudouridine-5'-phosphate glycosidase
VVGVPLPEESEIPQDAAEDAIQRALADAERDGIHGKATTPFLLSRMSQLTGGQSMQANLALLTHNARVGAELAASLAQKRGAQA